MKSKKIGLLLSYGYFVLSSIVGIFMSSFVVRTIGKTDYGIYQSVAAFVTYLVLLEFGTGRVMTRNISMLKKDGSEEDEIKKNVSTIITLNFILMLVILFVAACFWLSMDFIYQKSMTLEQITLAKQIFVFPVISLGISFFQQSFNGILLGYENYTFEKIVSIIKLVFRTALIVSVLLAISDIVLYVMTDAAVNLLFFLITVLYVRFNLHISFSFRYFKKSILKSILPLCLAMLLQGIVSTMNGTLDKFLISIILTPEDVAVYAIAMVIFSMYSTIANLTLGIYMPQVAKDMRNGLRGQDLTRTLVQPCRLNTFVTGLIAFGFVVVGKHFMTILYGKDFIEAYYCAIIVIIPMFFNTANNVIINVLDVLNKRHVRSLILMFTTGLNFVMTLFGIKYIGMFGAALATGVTMVLQVIILNFYYQMKIDINVIYLFKKSFSGIMPCIFAGIICASPICFLIENAAWSFFASGIVFLIIFGFLFYVFGANQIERQYVANLFSKVSLFRRK